MCRKPLDPGSSEQSRVIIHKLILSLPNTLAGQGASEESCYHPHRDSSSHMPSEFEVFLIQPWRIPSEFEMYTTRPQCACLGNLHFTSEIWFCTTPNRDLYASALQYSQMWSSDLCISAPPNMVLRGLQFRTSEWFPLMFGQTRAEQEFCSKQTNH